MILDTSIIVDLLRGESATRDTIARLEKEHVLKVSAITVFELELYVPTQKMNLILKRVKVIPITAEIAQYAGQICKKLIEVGKEIDKEDCLIAATALAQKEPVVTKNRNHFSRISGLTVV